MVYALALIAVGSLVGFMVAMYRLSFEKPVMIEPTCAVPLPIIRPIQKKVRRFA